MPDQEALIFVGDCLFQSLKLDQVQLTCSSKRLCTGSDNTVPSSVGNRQEAVWLQCASVTINNYFLF